MPFMLLEHSKDSTGTMPSDLISYEQSFPPGSNAENEYPPLDSGLGGFEVSELSHAHRSGAAAAASHINAASDGYLGGNEASTGEMQREMKNSEPDSEQDIRTASVTEDPSKVYLYDDLNTGNDPERNEQHDQQHIRTHRDSNDENTASISSDKPTLESPHFFETTNTLDMQRTTPNDNASQIRAEPVEQPFYVNAKQYYRILKRRYARAKLEENLKISRERRPYLHESRHKHAMRRPRGQGGRFLTAAEMAEMKRKEEEGSSANKVEDEDVPKVNVLPQQLPGPLKDNSSKSDADETGPTETPLH